MATTMMVQQPETNMPNLLLLQQTGLHQPMRVSQGTPIIKPALQPFRAATVTMIMSSMPEATVSGGPLRRARLQLPGTVTCTTLTTIFTGSITKRYMGFLFVA